MGGGTGTGAAPVIAEIAREANKLTIGVVTKPFKFEGIKKMERAEKGIEALAKNVDALIVIPNQNLIDTDMKNLTMAQAYAISDNVLKTDVIAIAEIITRHDEINVDFADVTTILTNAGKAHIAIGHGEGKDKVQDILNQVVTSKLLETSITGARRLIVNITMSPDLTVLDMAELTEAISSAADPGADIIFGNGTDENAKDTMDVTVIAADFADDAEPVEEAKPVNPFAKLAPKADEESKANAEAMAKAGVKAADNPNYYDDIFNIFKK
jgi:cell division protein FtsZ